MATQDRELRAAIDRVPGGASIFASVNGLHLQVRPAPVASAVGPPEKASKSLLLGSH